MTLGPTPPSVLKTYRRALFDCALNLAFPHERHFPRRQIFHPLQGPLLGGLQVDRHQWGRDDLVALASPSRRWTGSSNSIQSGPFHCCNLLLRHRPHRPGSSLGPTPQRSSASSSNTPWSSASILDMRREIHRKLPPPSPSPFYEQAQKRGNLLPRDRGRLQTWNVTSSTVRKWGRRALVMIIGATHLFASSKIPSSRAFVFTPRPHPPRPRLLSRQRARATTLR